MNEIERELQKEIREQKIVARGMRNMASRGRGFKGKVLYPSEYLKKKDRSKYILLENNGKVRIYNMYDLENVKTYDEIMQMSIEEGREYLIKLRRNPDIKTAQLKKKWGVTNHQIYGILFKKFDVPVDSAKVRGIVESRQKPQESKVDKMPQENNKSFTLELNGIYTGAEIIKRLQTIGVFFTDSESSKYKIELHIEEVEE